MELRQLEYFMAVVDHGSVTRGAGALHVSQPAVSQTLRGLEEEVGQPLLRRESTGVELTAAGKVLMRHALKILHAVDDMKVELGTKKPPLYNLRVGVLPTLARDYIPTVLRNFLDSHDADLAVRLIELPTQGLLRQVMSGDLHLAVLDLPVSEPAIEVTRLWEERLVLISNAKRAQQWSSPVPMHALAQAPFITMEPGYGLRDVLYRAAQTAGFQPHVLFELTSIPAIIGYVEAGFGVALVPERTVALAAREGILQILPVLPNLTRNIGVIWRAGRPLPMLAQAFRDFLIAAVPQLTRWEPELTATE